VNTRDLKFHKEHDWVCVEGDVGTFGITDYAQKSLGDIVYVELPEVGTELAADEPYAEIESVKAVSDVFAPMTGTVLEANEQVVDAPELLNSSPYEQGWLVKVRLSHMEELDALMSHEQYEAMLAEQGE
jgi:glycine cleavage system H protein